MITALYVLMQSVSRRIVRHEWPERKSLRDDRRGPLQHLREPPVRSGQADGDNEDCHRNRVGVRNRAFVSGTRAGLIDPGLGKKENGWQASDKRRSSLEATRGAEDQIESQHNMGLRTELSFCHGSCAHKNRADPYAATRLRAGESPQSRRYVSPVV